MIRINIDKAKLVAHDKRRMARAAEFAPYDKIIAAQIPGMDLADAEAARVAIRSKYAAMQIEIDGASTVEEIKAALEGN